MSDYAKIAIIAGGGDLPQHVLRATKAQGLQVYVAALSGFARAEDFDAPSGQFRLGELGKLLKTLKSEKVEAVSFAGIVKRPDFTALRPDMATLKVLPGLLKAAAKGDDALLSHIAKIFETEGIAIIGPQTLCQEAVVKEGLIGSVAPEKEHRADIEKARDVAKAIGALDIGQSAIVNDGLVLAVEAQEGTNQMLLRVASLPEELRTRASGGGGVMAKMLKPGQEERIDLPTFGLTTVQNAIAAGLSGIVVEAERAFFLDAEAAIAAADKAGLFMIALPPKPYAAADA